MASGPITSWQINGETVETVSDFILGGSKITVDGNCSHEIKRRLILGRKAMTNLESILKSNDITLPTKIHIIKAMIFPASFIDVSWAIKKAECKKIYSFELWCWRRILTEKAMAPHSSTLAWKIPWTEGPGGLPSMESHRVGHD